MTIPTVFWLVPIASVTSLCMAWYFFRQMMKEEEGNERMIEIASHVRKGAMAYLKQQYKVVGAVFVVLAVLFAFMEDTKSLGARGFPHRRFLLGFGRFFWHEDRYLCLGTHGQCRT